MWSVGRIRFFSFYIKKYHSISNRLFCCISFIVAQGKKIPRLLNSGWRRLRETWQGPNKKHLCILGGPVRNHLWICVRPVWNPPWILEGPIQKPIRGLAGLLRGMSRGRSPRDILRSSPVSPPRTLPFPFI